MSNVEMIKIDNVYRQQTLDELWAIAEKLGRVNVEQNWDLMYKVEIKFTNRNQSTVWATARGSKIISTLIDAIQEAERLQ